MRTNRSQTIQQVLDNLLRRRRRWHFGMVECNLRAHWADIVGPEIAARTEPQKLIGKTLHIHCDHDVWRTELAYLKPELLKRIAEVEGEGVVKDIFLK